MPKNLPFQVHGEELGLSRLENIPASSSYFKAGSHEFPSPN